MCLSLWVCIYRCVIILTCFDRSDRLHAAEALRLSLYRRCWIPLLCLSRLIFLCILSLFLCGCESCCTMNVDFLTLPVKYLNIFFCVCVYVLTHSLKLLGIL